jgi:hypothetical protein
MTEDGPRSEDTASAENTVSRQLGEWYDEWSAKHETTTPFRPEEHPQDDDYNLYHVFYEADADAFTELMTRSREISGLDPETGLPAELDD